MTGYQVKAAWHPTVYELSQEHLGYCVGPKARAPESAANTPGGLGGAMVEYPCTVDGTWSEPYYNPANSWHGPFTLPPLEFPRQETVGIFTPSFEWHSIYTSRLRVRRYKPGWLMLRWGDWQIFIGQGHWRDRLPWDARPYYVGVGAPHQAVPLTHSYQYDGRSLLELACPTQSFGAYVPGSTGGSGSLASHDSMIVTYDVPSFDVLTTAPICRAYGTYQLAGGEYVREGGWPVADIPTLETLAGDAYQRQTEGMLEVDALSAPTPWQIVQRFAYAPSVQLESQSVSPAELTVLAKRMADSASQVITVVGDCSAVTVDIDADSQTVLVRDATETLVASLPLPLGDGAEQLAGQELTAQCMGGWQYSRDDVARSWRGVGWDVPADGQEVVTSFVPVDVTASGSASGDWYSSGAQYRALDYTVDALEFDPVTEVVNAAEADWQISFPAESIDIYPAASLSVQPFGAPAEVASTASPYRWQRAAGVDTEPNYPLGYTTRDSLAVRQDGWPGAQCDWAQAQAMLRITIPAQSLGSTRDAAVLAGRDEPVMVDRALAVSVAEPAVDLPIADPGSAVATSAEGALYLGVPWSGQVQRPTLASGLAQRDRPADYQQAVGGWQAGAELGSALGLPAVIPGGMCYSADLGRESLGLVAIDRVADQLRWWHAEGGWCTIAEGVKPAGGPTPWGGAWLWRRADGRLQAGLAAGTGCRQWRSDGRDGQAWAELDPVDLPAGQDPPAVVAWARSVSGAEVLACVQQSTASWPLAELVIAWRASDSVGWQSAEPVIALPWLCRPAVLARPDGRWQLWVPSAGSAWRRWQADVPAGPWQEVIDAA